MNGISLVFSLQRLYSLGMSIGTCKHTLTFCCFRWDIGHHHHLHPSLRALPPQPGLQSAQQLRDGCAEEEQQGEGDGGGQVWYCRPQRGRLSKSDEWTRHKGQGHIFDGLAAETSSLHNTWNNTVDCLVWPCWKSLQHAFETRWWEAELATLELMCPRNNTRTLISKEPDLDLSALGSSLRHVCPKKSDLCALEGGGSANRTKCQLAKVGLAAAVCDKTPKLGSVNGNILHQFNFPTIPYL